MKQTFLLVCTFFLLFILAISLIFLLSCVREAESADMFEIPQNMAPIDLYNRRKDTVISIGMEKLDIESLLGEEGSPYGNASDYYIYSSQLEIQYMDNIAVKFYLWDGSYPKVYYTHLGLNKNSRLRDFYQMYDIPEEMRGVNTDYYFSIYQSESGYSMELLYDYEATQNKNTYTGNAHLDAFRAFRDKATVNNEEPYYYMIVARDSEGGLAHFDFGYIEIGMAKW